MITNKCIFIDIDDCLISTNSGRKYPLYQTDWKFNDRVIDFIKSREDCIVCIISNRDTRTIIDKNKYNVWLDLVSDMLNKIIGKIVHIMYYNTNDVFFMHPYPAGIFNFSIENDVLLNESIYISNNNKAREYSCIELKYYTEELNRLDI